MTLHFISGVGCVVVVVALVPLQFLQQKPLPFPVELQETRRNNYRVRPILIQAQREKNKARERDREIVVLGGGSRGERGEEIDPWWATSGCIPKNVAAVAYFATITNGPTEERNISLLCK